MDMNDAPKGNDRVFIDIHLRQWVPGRHSVRLRDLDGNIVELDGLVHDRPHQFILVELPATAHVAGADDQAIIDIPGFFTDYHPHNARVLGEPAPAMKHGDGSEIPATDAVQRIPHRQPIVERHPEHGIVWKHSGKPVNPAPLDHKGKPAERSRDQPAIAQAPLGVHRDIKPQ